MQLMGLDSDDQKNRVEEEKRQILARRQAEAEIANEQRLAATKIREEQKRKTRRVVGPILLAVGLVLSIYLLVATPVKYQLADGHGTVVTIPCDEEHADDPECAPGSSAGGAWLTMIPAVIGLVMTIRGYGASKELT